MSETQLKTIPTTARREAILLTLKSIINDLTGIDPAEIDIHTTFFELRVDSLLLIQANQIIQEKCGVRISLVQLFDELSTLDLLANYIDQQLPPEPVLRSAPDATAVSTPATTPASSAP